MSEPDARHNDNDLGRFLYRVDEPRWLLKAAIFSLFANRTHDAGARIRAPIADTVDGLGVAYRRVAQSILDSYDDRLEPFYHLLDVAISDYLLVLGLPIERHHHLLSYDLPLITKSPSSRARRGLLSRARERTSGVYRVQYESHVPTSLRAYHLVAQTDETSQIDQIHLTSDADRHHAKRIARDLRALAPSLGSLVSKRASRSIGRITELELRRSLGELTELTRRRKGEVAEAELGWRSEKAIAIEELTQTYLSGEVPKTRKERYLPTVYHPHVTDANLRNAAQEIEDLDLGIDYFTETDPEASTAHVYWRRYNTTMSPASRTTIRAVIAMSDATTTRPYAIMTYILGVLAVSLLTAALLCEGGCPIGISATYHAAERDAVVAALLLVPGFLYSRLNLPRRSSVSAQIQVVPLTLARAAIATAAIQAVIVASTESDLAYRIAFGLGSCLLMTFAMALLAIAARSSNEKLSYSGLPPWARGTASVATPIPPGIRIFASGAHLD